MSLLAGCGRNQAGSATGSAAIVGRVVSGGGVGKFETSAQLACPDFIITLNGSPATVTVENDCSFVIDDVQPSASYVLEVELVALGVTGTVELTNVAEAELIEIEVRAEENSLTIGVVRRATPDPVNDLPGVIDDNNVEIFLLAGTYEGDLTVDGNNFTLVGEAGEDCNDEGWTTITGDVVILKNNATFRNVRFEGSVEVEGNNTNFINVCFDGQLIIFGNNTDFDDDGNGDDDDGDDANHDDVNGNDNDNDNESD